eukprot:gb/GEZN01007521.1/.p1 GENE.gb/GEZN01007521.1/~~gb/GEZN01007521.1/.p1  ORF type:complete len:427 (-),score=53.99 gb/GEZN01007521.1/:228-1508(-)
MNSHYVAMEDHKDPVSVVSKQLKIAGGMVGVALATFTGLFASPHFFSSDPGFSMPAFFPKDGMDKALNTPSPPTPLQPHRPGDPLSLFLYSGDIPAPLTTDASSTPAWAYGAKQEGFLPEGGGARQLAAVETGSPGEYVKGTLLTYPSSVFDAKLRVADEKWGTLRRGIVKAVTSDGSIKKAYWYFHSPPKGLPKAPFPPPPVKRSFDWGRWYKTAKFFNGNPFLGVVPFMPKRNMSIPLDKLGSQASTLVDFSSPSFSLEESFGVLDDVVMGGLSLSKMRLEGPYLVLEGETVSERGGFCSVRTKNAAVPFNLSSYYALSFACSSSPPQTLKFILRDESDWNSIAFQTEFKATEELNQIVLPLADFVPVKTGRRVDVNDMAWRHMKQGSILSVQIMISKFTFLDQLNSGYREGPFKITVGSIRAI